MGIFPVSSLHKQKKLLDCDKFLHLENILFPVQLENWIVSLFFFSKLVFLTFTPLPLVLQSEAESKPNQTKPTEAKA